MSDARRFPFIPHSDDETTLWEVLEIAAESDKQYKVTWAGNDPSTGKPWEPSWVDKSDCTDDAVVAWEEKKKKSAARPKPRPKGASVSEKPTPKPNGKRNRQPPEDDPPTMKSYKRRATHLPPSPEYRASESKVTGPQVKVGPPRGVRKEPLRVARQEEEESSVDEGIAAQSGSALAAGGESTKKTGKSVGVPLSSDAKSRYDREVVTFATKSTAAVQPLPAPLPTPFATLLLQVEEIRRIQCEISIASNAAMKIASEVVKNLAESNI